MPIIEKILFEKIKIIYDTEWKNVGISASGGVDSSLTLYLLATEFKEQNLKIKIQPISYKIYHKPSQEPYLNNIINKIRNLTNYEYIKNYELKRLDPIESLGKNKDDSIRKHNLQAMKDYKLDAWYVADTLNPPLEIRSKWGNDNQRSKWRDEAKESALLINDVYFIKPVVNLNKADIISAYKKLHITDSLLDKTVSCDESYEGLEILNSTLPCGQCWWCNERRWGLESNGLDYEKYTK